MIEIKCYNLYGNNEVVVEKANGEKLFGLGAYVKGILKFDCDEGSFWIKRASSDSKYTYVAIER
jgi:hypothetical protein